MRQDERDSLMRFHILRILKDCGGYMLPETRLREHAELAIAPPPTGTEIGAALKFLEDDEFIAGVRPELGGPVKWKLTDKGRAS